MENTPAAQYLRVSTERQEYSLEFQSAGIASYALQHNFNVCQTYVDQAKSGLEIKHRQGLTQLLQDVLGRKHPYRAILVYDVSRWGSSCVFAATKSVTVPDIDKALREQPSSFHRTAKKV